VMLLQSCSARKLRLVILAMLSMPLQHTMHMLKQRTYISTSAQVAPCQLSPAKGRYRRRQHKARQH
jgi:hypothetical protein